MSYKFLNIFNSPSSDLLKLLKENIIGTPGHGMRYQHLEVQKKVDHIADPFYVNLSKGSSIIGTCCFCSRDSINVSKTYPSYYLRYFSFKDIYRRKQVSEDKAQPKSGLLRDELKSVLQGEGLGERSKSKFFHYAYVDPRNLRSVMLCNEFGFEPVRQFSTTIFHRLHPKKHLGVSVIENSEIEPMKERLRRFYKRYTMFSFENLFGSRKYYVLKDREGQIVAGVQAEPDSWKIHEMPGLSGKIILSVFSSTPYLKKIINKNYRFISLEGIFYLPGHEKNLEILFEHLLNLYKVNTAMIWSDTDSILYKKLRELDLGLVDKLNKEVRANVICKFIRFDKSEIKSFTDNPAYISGIDLT